MLIWGTVSWLAPASRNSKSSEPKDSRATSLPHSIRMMTSSKRGRRSLPALSKAFWTAKRAERPFLTSASAAAFCSAASPSWSFFRRSGTDS
ncbi:MAG: hypothetical protein HY293_14830 [Planctomycetes bacterium]|nr:hypothetical protein [Planctomycetota bacterium]